MCILRYRKWNWILNASLNKAFRVEFMYYLKKYRLVLYLFKYLCSDSYGKLIS